MHELYLLAIEFNRSRKRFGPRSHADLAREEQAFYEAHANAGAWKSAFRRLAPFPLVIMLMATLAGLLHLFER